MYRIILIASLLPVLRCSFLVSAFTPFPWVSKTKNFGVSSRLFNEPPTFYNDFEDFTIDDNNDDGNNEDEYIDTEKLGDWRAFRKSLSGDKATVSVSKENEDILRTQSEALADEYTSEVWAHATAVPEVGGFMARMPLEVEIYRNHKHSIMGKKLRTKYQNIQMEASMFWYRTAKELVEKEMQKIADQAQNGQIDSSELDDESSEMLQLYLDNQETWQEICLITSRDETAGTATALVLNRPMAFKLTDNLAQLVLHGGLGNRNRSQLSTPALNELMNAFGDECAIYIGGPDYQDEPATLIHGYSNLPGSVEIMPGIYKGGIQAAIQGVTRGLYKALDFRFFVGRHEYDENTLDLEVLLGKYQPIAGARTLALKQCISLPKPLWHEGECSDSEFILNFGV